MDIRKLATIIAAAALFASATANAFLQNVEQGLELASNEVSIPSREGTLLIRSCAECQTLRLRITSDTRCFIGDDLVPLTELRRRAGAAMHPLYVFYETDTDRVTRIVLDLI